jgi:hypothetical protein
VLEKDEPFIGYLILVYAHERIHFSPVLGLGFGSSCGL